METRKAVYCQFVYPSIHKWEDAPDEVYFLRNDHRHEFHFKITISVSHNDRAIEFILLKHWAMEQLPEMEAKLGIKKSCEDMAEFFINKLLEKYSPLFVSCDVSEDGENGAIVQCNDPAVNPLSIEQEKEAMWNRNIGGINLEQNLL